MSAIFYRQDSGAKAKKRHQKKSGSGSESETGSVSDTDEEDASTVNSKDFSADIVYILIERSG